MKITFKDPDAVHYSILDYVKDELGITDKYEIEDKVDEIQSEISEWFTYGEYLTIEYNFETKQMSIVKKK